MAPDLRSKLIAVRLTPAEVAMLKELADADGVYQSDVIRSLVRKEHAARFATVQPKPKKKKQ
jgi:hypothetical protein